MNKVEIFRYHPVDGLCVALKYNYNIIYEVISIILCLSYSHPFDYINELDINRCDMWMLITIVELIKEWKIVFFLFIWENYYQ